eukprot:GDKH01000484.1.p1 GENE.GDKH01000484.1~~GDKH01000484.1.p1  ORF type:complete len:168 (+),score=17.76 GDKH01000484.1:127-630(+)
MAAPHEIKSRMNLRIKVEAERARKQAMTRKLASIVIENYPTPVDRKMAPPPDDWYETHSCHNHYLDQTLKLRRNPYDIDPLKHKDVEPPQPLEILYTGVSKDVQGRKKYLQDQSKLGPHERHGRPVTTAMELGWSVHTVGYAMSPFARKPVIKDSFFRKTGVLKHDI